MTIVILEGVDCSGKDSFAEKLSKHTGFEILRGSSFEIAELGADGMYEHMDKLLNRDNIIINRFLYSNLVYAYIYKKQSMTDEQFSKLTKKMNENSILVYLHADIDIIKSRMAERGDDMIKLSDVSKIIRAYSASMLQKEVMPHHLITLDTGKKSAEELAENFANSFII